MLAFEWDEKKNKANRKKHGVWFEEAQSVFDAPNGRLFFDPDHSVEDERFILIGYSFSKNLLVVVHCHRKNDEVIRIISARRATKREKAFYEEGL